MDPNLFELLGSMPHLLDFPVTIFIVWAGLRVWKESKEMVIDMDTRHLEALQRVTDGMRSIREEVRVLGAQVGLASFYRKSPSKERKGESA